MDTREMIVAIVAILAGTDKAERDGIYAAQQQLAHASVTTTEIYAGRKGRKATPTR